MIWIHYVLRSMMFACAFMICPLIEGYAEVLQQQIIIIKLIHMPFFDKYPELLKWDENISHTELEELQNMEIESAFRDFYGYDKKI